jgi:hypothetical protein
VANHLSNAISSTMRRTSLSRLMRGPLLIGAPSALRRTPARGRLDSAAIPIIASRRFPTSVAVRLNWPRRLVSPRRPLAGRRRR